MDILDLMQWPAFVASVVAAYLVGSTDTGRRNIGFWVFLASNALWIGWGLHQGAWALLALQVCLALLNVRGLFKRKPRNDRSRRAVCSGVSDLAHGASR